MKIICKNNPEHDRFSVLVAMRENWTVDSNNYMVSRGPARTKRWPNEDDHYTCAVCGADTVVEEE